jgi:hypothetical protein
MGGDMDLEQNGCGLCKGINYCYLFGETGKP